VAHLPNFCISDAGGAPKKRRGPRREDALWLGHIRNGVNRSSRGPIKQKRGEAVVPFSGETIKVKL